MIESRWTGYAIRVLTSLAFVVCSIHPGWTQNGTSSGMEGFNAAMEKELRKMEALQAIQADRAGFVEGSWETGSA